MHSPESLEDTPFKLKVLKYQWNFRPHAPVISKFGETPNVGILTVNTRPCTSLKFLSILKDKTIWGFVKEQMPWFFGFFSLKGRGKIH